MASTEQTRLKMVRDQGKQFNEDMLSLARQIVPIINRHARQAAGDTDRTLPQSARVRDAIKQDIWRGVLKPYFIGTGDEALTGPHANSPYAQLIVEGIRGGIANEVGRQVSIVRRYTLKNPELWNYLTDSSRGLGEMTRHGYDAFHLFVDENGYRLSDRIWRSAVDVRSRIDRLMLYHIQQGTAAITIADELIPFLTGDEVGVTTRRPYGRVGSYSARRLARTEITAAAGRAVVNANIANPWVDGTKWNLSPSHPKTDNCDDNAGGGPGGDGVYPNRSLPMYPDHPHCLCYLTPEITAKPAEVTEQLRSELEAVRVGVGLPDDVARAIRAEALGQFTDIRRLRGAFSAGWMERALMTGDFTKQILGLLEGSGSAL